MSVFSEVFFEYIIIILELVFGVLGVEIVGVDFVNVMNE